MKHTAIIKPVGVNGSGKSLLMRATGKFYTPPLIAKNLVESLVQLINFDELESFSLIDPFCGDGRLLSFFINRACELKQGCRISWHVAFWDYDRDAVEEAQKVLSSLVKEKGLNVTLAPICHDSFVQSSGFYGGFDCVITNPPWETIKPDSRELAELSPDKQEAYRAALRKYDLQLGNVLPYSQPKSKYAGWGTNLSRCGTELALKLTRSTRLCGIVIPLSLLMDQMSYRLRQWMLEQATVVDVAHYPAEAKLFDGVDQETVSIILQKTPAQSFKTLVTQFDRKMRKVSSKTLRLSVRDLQLMDYCVPVIFGSTLLRIMKKWESLNTVGDLEAEGEKSLWLGRELDETRHKEFLSESGRYGFLKGRMIGRYTILEQPRNFIRENMRQIPESARHQRLAWRDVSRRSQARRMQAALIPSGMVTGNSLHVAYFQDDDLQRLRALLVLMNSLPFEFQVRSRLGTGHISLGIIRQIRIPSLDDIVSVRDLVSLLDEAKSGSSDAEITLEMIATKAYGLDRAEYQELLSHFEGLPKEHVTRLLSHPLLDSARLSDYIASDTGSRQIQDECTVSRESKGKDSQPLLRQAK